MAKRTGQFARVDYTVGGTPVRVMELREWSISASSEKIDANVAGTDWSEHLIGHKSWEGEATCVDADPYWLDLMDEHVTISFYDHADDANPKYVGTASIDFERSTPYDDLIETSLTFTGTGRLENGEDYTPPVTP